MINNCWAPGGLYFCQHKFQYRCVPGRPGPLQEWPRKEACQLDPLWTAAAEITAQQVQMRPQADNKEMIQEKHPREKD
jgi:hypothetical protein